MTLLRFAADENFDNNILRGLVRLCPELDVIRIQDTAVRAADDPTVLAWCASEMRILLTHDIRTITKYAYERVRQGLAMPGVVEVGKKLPTGRVIEDLHLLATASNENEWEGQVIFLPLG